jgi:hypothetical protein
MRVRIYKPTKSAAQSGRAKNHFWLLEPELLTPRTPEPLMGWLSAGDTLTELKGKLQFTSSEDAVTFAKRKGWDYVIEQPAERRLSPRNYLDNFRITRPEDEEIAAQTK